MFGKRLHILTVSGISITVDLSWFFIALLLSWSLAAGYFPHYYPGLNPGSYWTMGIGGMLGLFVSIILHELGHALTARRFDLPISRITLFIFGGVAELKKKPPSPKAEFMVAIAGPIVSVAIALAMRLIAQIGIAAEWPIQITAMAAYLAMINMIIVLFNLVPAFPLDGGRVFRAFLWWWKESLGWATRITSRMGSIFGFTLLFFGIFVLISGGIFIGMWWIILGLFLHQAASMSLVQYYVRKELVNAKVEQFMTKDPLTTPAEITVRQFLDQYVYQSHHHLYPVVDGETLLGYISLSEVKNLVKEEWETKTVKECLVPLPKARTISKTAHALEALSFFSDHEGNTLLVTDNDKLAGILTAQDLFKIISLKLELEQAR